MVRKIHIKESNVSRKWVNTELPKADWEKLRKFVKEQGYKYEASGAGNLVHVEMYLSSDEMKKVNDVIDQIDDGTYESYNRRANKSYIKENAITDMRKLGIVNSTEAGRKLDTYSYDFVNVQDCKLVPIDRPRTYAQAKKSLYPIIGVKDNMSIYQGYNKPRLTGPAVYGIFGNNDFSNVDGDDRVRVNFDECDKFYKVVPIDEDSYTNARDIRQGREQTVQAAIDDSGELQYDRYHNNIKGKKRMLTQFDIDMYDPTVNRKKYKDILTKNHLGKYAMEYDVLCDKFDEFMDRFHNINIRTIEHYNFTDATKQLDSFASAIDWLNTRIGWAGGINNYNSSYGTYEDDIINALNKANEVASKVDRALTNIGV